MHVEVGSYSVLGTKDAKLKKLAAAQKFCPMFVGPFKVLGWIGRSAVWIQLPVPCL